TDHFYKYGNFNISIQSGDYSLFLVDIFANQPYFRKRILNDLYYAIPPIKNVIVFCDFNTPYESLYLKPFNKRFWNAERKAGSGNMAGWPDKYPLLQIDHLWSAKNLLPVFSSKEPTDMSDHSLIISGFIKK